MLTVHSVSLVHMSAEGTVNEHMLLYIYVCHTVAYYERLLDRTECIHLTVLQVNLNFCTLMNDGLKWNELIEKRKHIRIQKKSQIIFFMLKND